MKIRGRIDMHRQTDPRYSTHQRRKIDRIYQLVNIHGRRLALLLPR